MGKSIDPQIAAYEADTRAEEISLQRVDEAGAIARPANIGNTYVEMEHESLGLEQPELFEAAGIERARASRVAAAGRELSAKAAERMLDGHKSILEDAADILVDTRHALAKYRRRGPKAKWLHYAAKGTFLLGDIAGIGTAAIWMGEIPAIAIVMATSAAAATVAAGLSGAEVRDVSARERRARERSQLNPELTNWSHLFEAPSRGWPFTKALVWVSGAVAGTIATGIFALRTSIEDPVIGLMFGGIAAAIAGASWIESYMYADEIADLIDNAEADYQRELKRHELLAGSPEWRLQEEARAEAESIRDEYRHRGTAASHHLDALRFGVLRRNPQVVGHGPPPEIQAIGQTVRRGGAK